MSNDTENPHVSRLTSPVSRDQDVSRLTSHVSLSFEFFPPRTDEQALILDSTWRKLARLNPEYLSVTFGAGGSTTESTRSTVLALQQQAGVPVAPHISCAAGDLDAVRELLETYRQAGIERLVALRGDKAGDEDTEQRCLQHANDLVSFVREQFGDTFSIEVACYPEFHPESTTPERELHYFHRKVEAGADGAITQYFFNADSYFRYLEDCQRLGIDIPITPGIMPITNYRQLARFSDFCGAEIPLWLRRRLEAFGDDLASVKALGEDVVTDLCQRLLDGGAPGLHFYTLNRANATLRIVQNLNSSGIRL